MTEAEINAFVEHLSVQATHVTPNTVDSWREVMGEDPEDGFFTFWEAFTYEVDDREFTLLAQGPGSYVVGVVVDDIVWERNDYDDYRDSQLDPDNGELPDAALTEREFNDLFDVEPVMYGAEGPMMNYWYPIDESEGSYRTYDPERAAVKIVDTPLCVVQVGNEYGLALTGGGMDLSWEICEAFVALGMLPPTHFADLPRMAGKGADDNSRLVVAAMRRSLIFERDNAQYRLERLERLAADLQEGRL